MSAGHLIRILGAALVLAGLVLTVSAGLARQDSSRTVLAAELTGPIGPATTSFITRAIEDAEAANATALIVEMDTPGGLESSMRDINQAILSAELPVIVFVHPPGARAASAGAFITYASHIAAMAPGTAIGAATPVQMGGGAEPGGAPEGTDPALEDAAEGSDGAPDAPGNAQALRNKAVNDAVAYIRSLAELREPQR